jgi:cytosine/adenosine deaminase-related metal-dependent hydrolase
MTTRVLPLGAALLLMAVPLTGQQRQPGPDVQQYVTVNAPVLALTHATLVDGTGAPARTDQTVIVRGDKIEAVGPSASVALPAGAQVIDLTADVLLPGIVGLHEHTYFGGVRRVTQMSASAPALYLGYGVTTGMTAGSQLPYHELNLKRSVDEGLVAGPRFFVAGPYLNGPSRIAFSRNLSTPEEARRVVAYWAGEGATWIKFLGTVSRAVLDAAIKEAHTRGLRVTGHLCSVTFTEAAAMGIDLLQHGFITNSDHVPGKRPDECPQGNMRVQANVDVGSPEVQASIRAIVAGKTAVASTLAAYETFVPERPIDQEAMELVHPEVRREVELAHANLGNDGGLVVPLGLLKKMMAWERAFVAAGGLLGAGSDPWGSGLLPGFGNLRNYELLLEAGFSIEDARIGSIVAGKQADLMVIRGDLLRTPNAIYNVGVVFRDGVGYDAVRLRQAARGRVGLN